MRTSLWLFIISLSFSILSCSGGYSVKTVDYFEKDVWNRFNSRTFVMDIQKPGDYDIFIDFSHSGDYPYTNLTIDLSYSNNEGETRVRPHTLHLVNEQGNFNGKKDKDGYYRVEYLAFDGLTIASAGKVEFIIDNVMPVYDLIGAHSIGIRVNKHKKKKE
jgi:gliding motility-associated lipoprotein GldH